MRWGVALGTTAALAAAAIIGSQMSQTADRGGAPAAKSAPPPSRDAVVAGLKEAFGAPGQALAGAVAGGMSGSLLTGSGLTPSPETTRSDEKELPADGDLPAGTRTTTVKTRVEGSGSRVSALSDFTVSERRGASAFNLRGKLVVSLDFCPSAEGKVPAEIELQASGDNNFANAAGSGGYSVNFNAKGRAAANVNDQAALVGYSKQFDGSFSIRGGVNVSDEGAGGSTNARSRTASGGSFEVSSTEAWVAAASAGGSAAEAGDTQGFSVQVTQADNPRSAETMALLLNVMVDEALKGTFERAQAKWRAGECVEVLVRPPTRDQGESNRTAPREHKEFEAAVRHRFENAELPVSIDATFTGKDSLEPTRIERSPGRFNYRAGADKDDYGRVDLKSTSKRGIGENRVLFDNRPVWVGEFKVTGSGPTLMVIEGRVRWRARPGSTTEFTPDSGEFRLTARRRDCTAHASGELGPADGELELKLDDKGEPTAYRGAGMKALPVEFKCPHSSGNVRADGAVVARSARDTVRMSAGFAPPLPWFSTSEEFQPVKDGQLAGQLSDADGRWRWQWRFKQ